MGRRKDLLEALGDKMLVGDDCWEWTGCCIDGYGCIMRDGHNLRAHRVVYELMVGPIPDGLQLDHTCHNEDASCPGGPTCRHRRCVRPDHLVPATQRDNVLRGRGPSARHARKTHCPKGHPLSGDNLKVYDGRRNCATCLRDNGKRRYKRGGETTRAQARVRTARYRARLKAEG